MAAFLKGRRKMHMEGQENMQSQPGLNLDTEILQKKRKHKHIVM